MSEKTIFKRIIDGEIPADVVYEDDQCLAFRDVNPQAPTHVLVIPKQEIASLEAVSDEDLPLIGHLHRVIRDLARQLELGDGYRVVTNQGEWWCRVIVNASGAYGKGVMPGISAAMPLDIHQVHAADYRNVDQLPDGGVLVVGASATGLQLANEIHASGRPVTLAVGEHVRMPRNYRGADIDWWLANSGVLDETYEEVEDIARARRLPSPQLVGSPDANLDINA